MAVFRLPDLGEGLHEAEIVAWHVAVGDRVVADQPLVSVETEKAVVEIPSPQAGRIARLFGKPGERIEVGAVLVEFAEGPPADTGTVVGEIPVAPARATLPTGAPAEPAPARAEVAVPKASPAVRALAHRLGLDLARVPGTGYQDSITISDVERAATSARAEALATLSGVRRSMAINMARSRAEVAPATVNDEADVDAWPKGTDPMLRLIRAVVAGCAAEPVLNAWYDPEHLALRQQETINLGVAIDTPAGLFVPVLNDVGRLSAAELRRALDALKAAVNERRVAPQEMRGQTITLSNFGTMGGRFAALTVMPPQVAILGAGRIAPRATVAADGKLAARRLLPLSLTFDHRAVTGGEATRFLVAVIADLEKAN
jgi:pyruvate dehydrogenase E2 component (dihydrolipoamide acetyltransferase)